MSSDNAITVKGLGKSYHIYKRPQDRLMQSFLWGRKKLYRDFWALKDVSFDVKRGETVGIIGRNGSGKSTLLQIICGTLKPTAGEVEVNGRIAALLELGSGFNPEFTGRENVYLNAAILGLEREEIDERYDRIIEFADIGSFIDQPVKTYSSGMYVRLAFAVVVNVDPEILVVDEALSVGDMFFQAKCMTKMKQLRDRGVTLLFVSHNIGSVKSICNKAVMLQDGVMTCSGDTNTVIERYCTIKREEQQETIKNKAVSLNLSAQKKLKPQKNASGSISQFDQKASFERIQNGKARFENVQLLDEEENIIEFVEYNQNVILRMHMEVCKDIDTLTYGYHIRNKNGLDIIYSDNLIENKPLLSVQNGERYVIDWRFKASLAPGMYNIVTVLSIPIDIDAGAVEFCDLIPIAYQFEMGRRIDSLIYGLVHWDNEVKVNKLL